MVNLLLWAPQDEQLYSPCDIPRDAEPMLRSFWIHIRSILGNRSGVIKEKDIESYARYPHSSTAKWFLRSIIFTKRFLTLSPTTWRVFVQDYADWHRPCNEAKNCVSLRLKRDIVPDDIKPILSFFDQIHPDRPLPDLKEYDPNPLGLVDLRVTPHYFSACVDYFYAKLQHFYSDWELCRRPDGISYIVDPHNPNPLTRRPPLPFFNDHNWCMAGRWCLTGPPSPDQHLQHRIRYRYDARMSIALALHPRVGRHSPLRHALKHPYGGDALLQMLYIACNWVPDIRIPKKSVKRPRRD
jgi:hypothetical protein